MTYRAALDLIEKSLMGSRHKEIIELACKNPAENWRPSDLHGSDFHFEQPHINMLKQLLGANGPILMDALVEIRKLQGHSEHTAWANIIIAAYRGGQQTENSFMPMTYEMSQRSLIEELVNRAQRWRIKQQ